MSGTLPFHEYSTDALVEKSVRLLRHFAPTDDSPYYGCFSGGKDSCAIKELCRIAGVPVEWHYSVTGIDPPELMRFIKQHHAFDWYMSDSSVEDFTATGDCTNLFDTDLLT